MRLLAPILIVITCCVSPAVFGSQPVNKPDVISTYKQLIELRKSDSELLLDGNGVMVIGSAAKSKLKSLDIILSFNDKPIYSVSNLQHQIAVNDPEKESYTVTIQRAGNPMNLVLAPQDFELKLSDMNPIELGQILNAMSDSTANKSVVQNTDAMTTQYLQGRPFRTPNNRTSYAKLPSAPTK